MLLAEKKMQCILIAPLHDCLEAQSLCVGSLLVVTWHSRVCFRATDSGVEVSTHHDDVAALTPVSNICFQCAEILCVFVYGICL